jgi:hypothetical protein
MKREERWQRLVYPIWRMVILLAAIMVPALIFAEIWLTQVPKYRLAMDKIRVEEEMERHGLGPESSINLEEQRAKIYAMQQEERILEEEIEVLHRHTDNLQDHEPSGAIRRAAVGCSDLEPLMDRQSNLIRDLTR